MSEPVAEVVTRAQITNVLAAEVRRLVPAVAGMRQRCDHELEVRLHRLGLALELRSVRVREAGARLGFELVGRDVLRFERKRLGEIVLEVGDALAGNAVDQVERNVVESGFTQHVDGAPDVVRAGSAFEHVEQSSVKGLSTERHAVDAVSAEELSQLGGHGLRIRLDRHLAGTRQRREQSFERRGLGERRRAAAEEDRLELG